MHNVGLIAVDMDGTLLNTEHQISQQNAQALLDARRQGIEIAICSGRMVEDASFLAREAGLPCWICGGNGGRVLDAPYGNLLANHIIAPQAAERCLALMRRYVLDIHAFVGDSIVIQQQEIQPLEEAWYARLLSRGIAGIHTGEEAMDEATTRGLNKLLVMASDPEQMERLAALTEALGDVAGIDITSSWSNNIEIMPSGIHKGTALAQLAQRLGVPQERVMAIGDQENDRQMLTWAGYSVAMGNAPDSIRSLCRFITDDNAHDGVATAIRRWALP